MAARVMAKPRLKLVYSRPERHNAPRLLPLPVPQHDAVPGPRDVLMIFAAGMIFGALGFWALCNLIPAFRALML